MSADAKLKESIKSIVIGNLPLTLVRTRDPGTVSEAIEEISAHHGIAKRVFKWRQSFGLTETVIREKINHQPDGSRVTSYTKSDGSLRQPNATKLDGVLDDLLRAESNSSESNKSLDTSMNNFILVVSWPQFQLVKGQCNLITYLYLCSLVLPRRQGNIILIAPPDFTLPPELDTLFNCLEYNGPDKSDIVRSIERKECFRYQLENLLDVSRLPTFSIEQKDQLANALVGLTNIQIWITCTKAISRFIDYLPDNIDFSEFLEYLQHCKADLLKDNSTLELMKPISFDEVGGLDGLKLWVSRRKNCFTQSAIEFGLQPPKGLLLLGVSGVGKSLSAKAIASELQLPSIKFNVSSVFDKYVGNSEAKVRSALKTLETIGDAVVYIDEIDKIFQNDSGGDSGVGKRVLSTILNFMQESTAKIFWVFTANRVGGLPPELLRPGRIDDKFIVLPPSIEEVSQIVNIHLRKRKQPEIPSNELLEFSTYAEENMFSGAEIEGAVNEAVIDLYNARHDGKKSQSITQNTLLNIIKDMKPIVNVNKIDFLEMITMGIENCKFSSHPSKAKIHAANILKRLKTTITGKKQPTKQISMEAF
jgi:AAA+ superfamily predicted ATPase